MFFFGSREAAETRHTDHPGVVIYTLEEAYCVAQISIDLMSAVDPIG